MPHCTKHNTQYYSDTIHVVYTYTQISCTVIQVAILINIHVDNNTCKNIQVLLVKITIFKFFIDVRVPLIEKNTHRMQLDFE